MQYLWLLCIIAYASGVRLKDAIYQQLDATHACFKTMNATHEFGCTGDFAGNTGVLFVVNASGDLQMLQLPQTGGLDVVVVLRRRYFTVDTLTTLEHVSARPDSANVRGVILAWLNSDESAGNFSYSEDTKCPNQYSSFYAAEAHREQRQFCQRRPWNPYGNSLLRRRWSFPIMLLNNQTQITDVYQCHRRLNAGRLGEWPHCAAELYAVMAAAGGTQRCWRRSTNGVLTAGLPTQYCRPLGSYNVHGWLLPRRRPTASTSQQQRPNGGVVVVAARTDGATMFDALAPAADSALVGLVTLLAAARALAALRPLIAGQNVTDGGGQRPNNVLFMLFSGESFDYIGSERFAYDALHGAFPDAQPHSNDNTQHQHARVPFNLSDIGYYLELNQLAAAAGPDAARQLFVHSDPVTRVNATAERVEQLTAALQAAAGRHQLQLLRPAADQPLPPASLHALLRANSSIAGVVLTDHNSSYNNRFYHSVYDSAANVGWQSQSSNASGRGDSLRRHIVSTAATVVDAVFSLLTGQPPPSSTSPVNATWVSQLLECYLVRSNCSAFLTALSEPMNTRKQRRYWLDDRAPLPTYVSVYGSGTWTKHTYLCRLTGNLLAIATGNTDLTNITSRQQCVDSPLARDSEYTYQWLVNAGADVHGEARGYCVRSLVDLTPAVSPAFNMPDYDWSSGRLSSWTESQWFHFRLRLFVQPSHWHDICHVLLGLVVTLLLGAVTLFTHRHADVLFDRPGPHHPPGYPHLQSDGRGRDYGAVQATFDRPSA